jgi:hypothetical protein
MRANGLPPREITSLVSIALLYTNTGPPGA